MSFIYKSFIFFVLTVLSFSHHAQKDQVSISDVNFKYNGQEIEINYKLNNPNPENLYRISINAITDDKTDIIPFEIDGFLNNLSPGNHSIKWSQKKEGIVFDEEISFELSASLSSKMNIPLGKHLTKSIIFPGLGDYKLKNKKHYFLFGLLAYGSLYGSYHFNALSLQNYDDYLLSNDYESAQHLHKKARQNKLSSNILALSAGLIWTADIFSIYNRYKKIDKNLTEENSAYYYNKANQKFSAKSKKKHINTKELYVIALEDAQSSFDDKDYSNASMYLSEFYKMNPPNNLIEESKELQSKLKVINARIKEFNSVIQKASSLMEETKYDLAIIEFKKAKLIDNESDYPDEQIALAKQKLKNIGLEKNYNDLISKGEKLFEQNKYKEARPYFEQAKAIFDREQPNDRIKKIDSYYEEKERIRRDKLTQAQLEQEKREERIKNQKIDAEYKRLVELANENFDNDKKMSSLDYYEKASKLKPYEELPKKRIKLIQGILNPNLVQNSNVTTSSFVDSDEIDSPSDVDIDIKETNVKENSLTYVLIIGNEDYSSFQTGLSSESNVDFAENDARIFEKYCIKTFGIPKFHIKTLINATSTKMRQGITWLKTQAEREEGKAKLIFYYSGHGLPDENTKEPYLIPVDVSGNNIEYGIKLDEVFKDLTEFSSERITLFLDACFSGGARNEGLVARKSLKISPKEETVSNNMVVFSSSTGDESSGVFRDKKHGYFTYFLLKKLQQKRRFVTYEELADYINKEVLKITSLIDEPQTPQIRVSSTLGDQWKNWSFK